MTGLFFGSFNPIHTGHTSLAKYLLENVPLSELWFVVSPHNPLKEQADLWEDSLRLQLVETAITDEPKFKACSVEFELPKPNYTCDTLAYLSAKFPERQFALLIGADNLAVFDQWRNYEQILRSFRILVYPRPEIDLLGISKKYPQAEIIENAPLFPVSSTEIRELLRQKKDASSYLAPAVWEKIKQDIK